MDGNERIGERRMNVRPILGRWMLISVHSAATIDALRRSRCRFDVDKIVRLKAH